MAPAEAGKGRGATGADEREGRLSFFVVEVVLIDTIDVTGARDLVELAMVLDRVGVSDLRRTPVRIRMEAVRFGIDSVELLSDLMRLKRFHFLALEMAPRKSFPGAAPTCVVIVCLGVISCLQERRYELETR